MKSLCTIIAGSRKCFNYDDLKLAISLAPWEISTVISGMANGADTLGIRYANDNNLVLVKFPAKWDKYGKGAGHIRNKEMAKHGKALIAMWDMQSPGTRNMINLSITSGLAVLIFDYPNHKLVSIHNAQD